MRTTLALLVGAAVLTSGTAQAQVPGKTTPAFKIVVIAGEDAVNVIQQKTAVAPIIEVRDRNNLPIPGVTVTFAVSGQGATFAGGVQSLTVVTNAAGQAAAAGLTPTATGALQISATATFQGQTVAATIAQSNVMTAAQATAAGVAAGGGGGISGTTIGILAAAVGGGAVAATQVGKKEPASVSSTTSTTSPNTTSTTTASGPAPTTPAPSPSPTPAPAPTPQPTNVSLSGDIDYILTGPDTIWVDRGMFAGIVITCMARYRDAGRVTLTLVVQPGGQVSGTLSFAGRRTDAANNTCSAMPYPDFAVSFSGTVTGTSSSLQFTHNYRQTGFAHDISVLPYTMSGSVSFGGSIDGGTLIHNIAIETNAPDSHESGTMTGTTTVTLR